VAIMRVVMDLPSDLFLDEEPEKAAARVRLSAALLMYQTGELSAGAASELAGVDRYTFYAACKRYGLPVLRHTPSEVEQDLEALDAG